jgi:hypothetical protein
MDGFASGRGDVELVESRNVGFESIGSVRRVTDDGNASSRHDDGCVFDLMMVMCGSSRMGLGNEIDGNGMK